MNEDTTAFPSGFPLYEFPDLTEEVLFAYHLQIGKLLYLNAAFEKVWNLSRMHVISNLSLLADSVHPDDRTLVTEAFTTLQTDRQKQNIEFRIQSPGEGQKWIRLNAYLSQKGNTEMIVGMAMDITAERSYSDTLHKFNDKKNSILQILSHDLLGPLGNIQLSSSLLSEHSLLKEDKSLMKMLGAISNSSKRSVDLIKDLINTEFLQTSESAFVKQRIDIVKVVTTMIAQYQQSPLLIHHRFGFTSSADSLYVRVDESKFTQAINNLISNALKFTPDEGTIEVSIGEPDEKNMLITVRDNGIGIPADLQPFLFDKFTKARRPGINGQPSHGLGMSIIKTIVEWHNGRI